MKIIDHADRVPAEAWWLHTNLWEQLGIPRPAILHTRVRHEEWWRNEEPVISFWPCYRGAGGFATTMVR